MNIIKTNLLNSLVLLFIVSLVLSYTYTIPILFIKIIYMSILSIFQVIFLYFIFEIEYIKNKIYSIKDNEFNTKKSFFVLSIIYFLLFAISDIKNVFEFSFSLTSFFLILWIKIKIWTKKDYI